MFNLAPITIIHDYYFCPKDIDGAIGNPSYGTLGRFKPMSEPDRVVTDEVISNEDAVYETMPDNDDVKQSVQDHNETDYDVIL